MRNLSTITALLLPALAFATPTSPSNLTFTHVTGNSVTINWQDNSDSEIAYKIYMNATLVKIVPADSEKTTITGLKANTAHNFTVVATDAFESRINIDLKYLYTEDGELLGSGTPLSGDLSEILISHDEKKAYIKSHSTLTIFDISDKSYIKLINSYTSKTDLFLAGFSDDEKKLYFVEGDFGYCSIDEGEKFVMDISNPANLTAQKITTIPNNLSSGLSNLKNRTISKDGKIKYSRFGDDWETFGIAVKNISNPNNPVTIHELDLKGDDDSIWIKFMTLTEDDKYLLVEGEGSSKGSKDTLHVIDVSDPSHPTITAKLTDLEIETPDKFGLSSDGTKLYAASLYGDITIIDISDISHPTVIKTIAANHNPDNKIDSKTDYWIHPENDIIFSEDNKKLYIGRSRNFEIVNL